MKKIASLIVVGSFIAAIASPVSFEVMKFIDSAVFVALCGLYVLRA